MPLRAVDFSELVTNRFSEEFVINIENSRHLTAVVPFHVNFL